MTPSFATLEEALSSMENLLISRFKGNPVSFVEEVKSVIEDVLSGSPQQSWSIQSFAWDLQNAYAWHSFSTYSPEDTALGPRPEDKLLPAIDRLAIETWTQVKLRSYSGEVPWSPAVRYVDQFYSMFCGMCAMPLKNFHCEFSDNVIDACFGGFGDISTVGLTGDAIVIKELKTKLIFVQDRVSVLQTREKLLMSTVETNRRRILSLRHFNSELTHKLAMHQDVAQRRNSTM